MTNALLPIYSPLAAQGNTLGNADFFQPRPLNTFSLVTFSDPLARIPAHSMSMWGKIRRFFSPDSKNIFSTSATTPPSLPEPLAGEKVFRLKDFPIGENYHQFTSEVLAFEEARVVIEPQFAQRALLPCITLWCDLVTKMPDQKRILNFDFDQRGVSFRAVREMSGEPTSLSLHLRAENFDRLFLTQQTVIPFQIAVMETYPHWISLKDGCPLPSPLVTVEPALFPAFLRWGEAQIAQAWNNFFEMRHLVHKTRKDEGLLLVTENAADGSLSMPVHGGEMSLVAAETFPKETIPTRFPLTAPEREWLGRGSRAFSASLRNADRQISAMDWMFGRLGRQSDLAQLIATSCCLSRQVYQSATLFQSAIATFFASGKASDTQDLTAHFHTVFAHSKDLNIQDVLDRACILEQKSFLEMGFPVIARNMIEGNDNIIANAAQKELITVALQTLLRFGADHSDLTQAGSLAVTPKLLDSNSNLLEITVEMTQRGIVPRILPEDIGDLTRRIHRETGGLLWLDPQWKDPAKEIGSQGSRWRFLVSRELSVPAVVFQSGAQTLQFISPLYQAYAAEGFISAAYLLEPDKGRSFHKYGAPIDSSSDSDLGRGYL